MENFGWILQVQDILYSFCPPNQGISPPCMSSTGGIRSTFPFGLTPRFRGWPQKKHPTGCGKKTVPAMILPDFPRHTPISFVQLDSWSWGITETSKKSQTEKWTTLFVVRWCEVSKSRCGDNPRVGGNNCAKCPGTERTNINNSSPKRNTSSSQARVETGVTDCSK